MQLKKQYQEIITNIETDVTQKNKTKNTYIKFVNETKTTIKETFNLYCQNRGTLNILIRYNNNIYSVLKKYRGKLESVSKAVTKNFLEFTETLCAYASSIQDPGYTSMINKTGADNLRKIDVDKYREKLKLPISSLLAIFDDDQSFQNFLRDNKLNEEYKQELQVAANKQKETDLQNLFWKRVKIGAGIGIAGILSILGVWFYVKKYKK